MSTEYHEYRLHEDRPGEFTLTRNGWGIGYTFMIRKHAEQAMAALNDAIALDYVKGSALAAAEAEFEQPIAPTSPFGL